MEYWNITIKAPTADTTAPRLSEQSIAEVQKALAGQQLLNNEVCVILYGQSQRSISGLQPR
ncbi:hypothetical protein GGR94_003693 [Sulfitobacter geojensis]|nr:hypothetical protein [Sulfitobacter geojensis]